MRGWTSERRQSYLMRFPCSVSVQCHPGVCGLFGLPACGPSVCDWWVWERVWKYSVTQESNVAACGFLTGSIVVEVICFPEERTVPSFLPLLHHWTFIRPPHTHTPHTLGTRLIRLIAWTKQWRRTELDRVHVCVCIYIYIYYFLWLISVRI